MSRRVLITGMTAHHYSPVVVERSMSFTHGLATLLRDAGYGVHIAQPSVTWDKFYLDEYDHVLVGIAPPMAISANGIYGALSVISQLHNSEKMTFFVDSPEHWQIFANIKAITKNPECLFKEFYSRRSGYFSAAQTPQIHENVLRAIEILNDQPWRRTIYPVLPWSDEQFLTSNTPENARISFVGVHIDSVFEAEESTFNSHRDNKWLVENEKSRWTRDVVSSLSFPSFTVKQQKLKTDEQIADAMSQSLGVLMGPGGDKKFWWSPRYVQALNTSTPVATEWKDSCNIGSSWNHLAAGIEAMSQIDRFELAVTQKKEYFDNIDSREKTTSYLRTLIGSK